MLGQFSDARNDLDIAIRLSPNDLILREEMKYVED